jgi:hypothetical protein
MTDKELIYKIILIKIKNNLEWERAGKDMFELYTEFGYPPDMFLQDVFKTIPMSDDDKLATMISYQNKMAEHKIKSGITDKRLEELQKRNLRELHKFIEKGEINIY